jgi:hypothetical protein
MPRVLTGLALSLLLFSPVVPALADQYDDCLAGCGESVVASCIEQARLSAGNIQEEAELIAACEKARENCLKGCSDAESQNQPPPQEQTEKN